MKKHPSNIGNISEQGIDSELAKTQKAKSSTQFKQLQHDEIAREKKQFNSGKRFTKVNDYSCPNTWKLR